jgi:hypothetical protein
MAKVLSVKQLKAFNLLFVEGKSDEEAAKELKLKDNQKNKNSLKKQIAELKSELFQITQRVLKESDIGEYWP